MWLRIWRRAAGFRAFLRAPPAKCMCRASGRRPKFSAFGSLPSNDSRFLDEISFLRVRGQETDHNKAALGSEEPALSPHPKEDAANETNNDTIHTVWTRSGPDLHSPCSLCGGHDDVHLHASCTDANRNKIGRASCRERGRLS